MPRINVNEVENYNTSSSGEFFSLKNDKDTAVVHFLAETIDDLDILVVHKVKVGDKYKNINCLRRAGEPIDNCPLCAAGYKQDVRVFVQLYDVNEDKVKIWDRGRSFVRQLEPFARRTKILYTNPFEIERQGAAGDMKTTYGIFPLEVNEDYPAITADDLPERVEICGPEKSIVLDKSYDELVNFVETGSFETVSQPVRRNSAPTYTQQSRQPEQSQPRTSRRMY